MRAFLLIGVFLSSLLYPSEVEGRPRTPQKKARRRTVQKSARIPREVRTLEEKLSPNQVNEKIASIRGRIVNNSQMDQRHKQILLEVFDDVAQTSMGRWIFEKAHPNLNFTVKKLGAGYSGVYGTRSKTITLSKFNNALAKSSIKFFVRLYVCG